MNHGQARNHIVGQYGIAVPFFSTQGVPEERYNAVLSPQESLCRSKKENAALRRRIPPSEGRGAVILHGIVHD